MTIRFLLSISFCLWATIVLAQPVSGIIKSQSGEGVSFATVAVLNSAVGSVAGKDGTFSLNLAKGMYQVQISAVGFATKIQPVTVTDQPQTVNVVLADNANALSEVVVTADKVEASLQKTPLAVTSLFQLLGVE